MVVPRTSRNAGRIVDVHRAARADRDDAVPPHDDVGVVDHLVAPHRDHPSRRAGRRSRPGCRVSPPPARGSPPARRRGRHRPPRLRCRLRHRSGPFVGSLLRLVTRAVLLGVIGRRLPFVRFVCCFFRSVLLGRRLLLGRRPGRLLGCPRRVEVVNEVRVPDRPVRAPPVGAPGRELTAHLGQLADGDGRTRRVRDRHDRRLATDVGHGQRVEVVVHLRQGPLARRRHEHQRRGGRLAACRRRRPPFTFTCAFSSLPSQRIDTSPSARW